MRRSGRYSEALEGILRALGYAGYCLEYLPVMALEVATRLWQRLDRRLYREHLRVRTVREGRLTKDTGRFVILVLYAGAIIPALTLTFIEALKQSRFNLVVVSNGDLSSTEASDLLESCCLLVERNNIGRDFGGYKDGISIINRRFGPIKRLVIANDSVFYLPPGLEKLIADLDSVDDFIGVSETYDHHYHVASFLMSFGPAVIGSTSFRKFWENYRPIGTRRWAIFNGEGALTKVLMREGFCPKVLFRAQDVEVHLRRHASDDTMGVLSLLPSDARREVAGDIKRGLALADAIFAATMSRNQLHTAGFLFHRHGGLPLVKRDIFYRDIYPLEEIESALKMVEPTLRAEILSDVVRRGRIGAGSWFRRLLFRHSIV